MKTWEDFEVVTAATPGWTELPHTAWAVMLAWVAGPETIRIQKLDESVFGSSDEWANDWILEMLSEAGVPAPPSPGWRLFYSGDFDSSSRKAQSAIPDGVPVRPTMMLRAMMRTRSTWESREV